MLEKHVKRLGFEPTTVQDYSKPLSNFTGHFRGQDSTETQTYASEVFLFTDACAIALEVNYDKKIDLFFISFQEKKEFFKSD